MIDRSPGAARVERLADDGVFGYVQPDGSWFINNCGFVDAGGHTVLIDTCATERRTRALLAAIEATTGPVSTLVNTHHHSDHTNGNHLVPAATIVGHRKTRTAMLAAGLPRYDGVFEGADWGELALRVPEVVFDEWLTVYAGPTRIDLIHPGHAAHTTNDVLAWLPEQRVLFAGDLVFNGGSPFALMGSVAGWRAALDVIRELDPVLILPGHGPAGDLAMVDTVDAYLEFVQQTAERGQTASRSPLAQATETGLGRFAALTEPERLVGNLHRAYAELDGAAWGADLDLAAALADMITYHGGPIHCFA